jgi:YggT family protein
MLENIVEALIATITVYRYILLIRILLTWLPSINWYNQPFRFLASVTDPVLEPFRRIIPPIGMIDISAVVLFIVLQIIEGLLRSLVPGPVMAY